MDIYEFAMQMEKDGEVYYRELASKVQNKGVAKILNMMADDEVKHYKIISAMRDGSPDMATSPVLSGAKNIFKEISSSRKDLSFEASHKEALQKAMEIEEKSEQFYLEKQRESDSEGHKALFGKLADEERRHVHLLDHMIEFVTKPDSWLDDAEFSNLEEY